MRLVVVALLLSGCVAQPYVEVEVAWSTLGRASVPDHEVGARLEYVTSKGSYSVSEWHRGYENELDIFVDPTASTAATICVTLERRTPIDPGEWGCSDCPEAEYVPLTMEQCRDAQLDADVPRVTFELAIVE